MYCAATVGTRCHPSYNILHIIQLLHPPHGSIPRTHSNGREPQPLLLPLHPRRSVRPLPRRSKCAERRRHIRKVRARHGRRRRRRQRCRPQRRTSEEGEAVRPTGPGRCFCVYHQRHQGSPLHIVHRQTGRHRPPQGTQQGDKPYGKPAGSRGTVRRGGRGGLSNPGRVPAGTPPGITAIRQAPSKAEKDHAKSELSRKLSSAEMKAWLESRMIAEGVLDMSVSMHQAAMHQAARLIWEMVKNLPNDEWIKSNGIFPPGHPHAPPTAGLVFWRLIDQTFQKVPHSLFLSFIVSEKRDKEKKE